MEIEQLLCGAPSIPLASSAGSGTAGDQSRVLSCACELHSQGRERRIRAQVPRRDHGAMF